MDHDDYGLGGGDMEVLVQLRRFGERELREACVKRNVPLNYHIISIIAT